MANPWLLLLATVALGGTLAGGYQWGHQAAQGEHALQRQKDIEVAYKAGAADLDAESLRAQTAQRQRDALARQLKEIDRDAPVPPRPDCRWTDAEFRLLESRRAAYLAADREQAFSPLPGVVPRDAGNHTGPTTDGAGSAGLGLRLPSEAAGVPGLGSTAQ